MQTRKLSKADYYKSRNIMIPKPLQKIVPQPSIHRHLIEPMTIGVVKIKRHIETKTNKEIHELNQMKFESILHQLQVQIQDLNRILSNKEDQIKGMKKQKEIDDKKIFLLERELFDLKTQISVNKRT